MEISKSQAVFLLDAIASKPLTTTFAAVIKGIQIDQELTTLIKGLSDIANASEESEAEVVSAVAESEVSQEAINTQNNEDESSSS